MIKFKNALKNIVILICIFSIGCFTSCKKPPKLEGYEGIWENALFTNDQELGFGDTEVTVDMRTGDDKAVEVLIYTDKTTLYEAMFENDLIQIASPKASDKYHNIVSVNNIPADYDNDGVYWALYCDTVPVETLIEDTQIISGQHYELIYTVK